MERTSQNVRPISARALQTVGDTLRPYLSDADVLDLFCGMGRFGEMALEEGAKTIAFVDLKPQVSLKITSSIQVFRQDALRFLANTKLTFDIVFADPPFSCWTPSFTQTLFTSMERVVVKGSIFLVKYPARVVLSVPVSSFLQWKSRRIGESELIYFRYEST